MQTLFRTRTESSSVRLSWVQLSWDEMWWGGLGGRAKWRQMCLQMSFQLAIGGGAKSIAVISLAGRVGVLGVSALMRSLSRRNPVKVLSLSTNPTHTTSVSKRPRPIRFSDLHANFLQTPRFPALYFSITRPNTLRSCTLSKAVI